jgi:hypothetical protein
MAEAQPQPLEDNFLNVYLTAYLGVGIVITVQSEEDQRAASDSD